MHGRKTHEPYKQKIFFIVGAAVPGEASETMVELCLWPSIVILDKLAIYCDSIWYILSQKNWAGKNLHAYLVSGCVE